ncbi:MAG: transcriptional regulator [Alphaproteobacteria bacterium]|jgi:predicted transcriptional regulator|nr:transcriptional regulator [Alphaproteobacteria bacterium]
MNRQDEKTGIEIQRMAAEIVSAFVKATPVSPDDLPKIIRNVSMTLADLASGESGSSDAPVPAVPIERSVNRNYIVCLEDGKRFKVLKSHLRTAYNMTPEEYRKKWGLPDDYPMVAPGYAARRSAIAKRTGLGRRDAAGRTEEPGGNSGGDNGEGGSEAQFQAA